MSDRSRSEELLEQAVRDHVMTATPVPPPVSRPTPVRGNEEIDPFVAGRASAVARQHRALQEQADTLDIPVERLLGVLEAQGGTCAVCSARGSIVDVDEDTGRVRGIMCRRCLRRARRFGFDLDRYRSMVRYLERPPGFESMP